MGAKRPKSSRPKNTPHRAMKADEGGLISRGEVCSREDSPEGRRGACSPHPPPRSGAGEGSLAKPDRPKAVAPFDGSGLEARKGRSPSSQRASPTMRSIGAEGEALRACFASRGVSGRSPAFRRSRSWGFTPRSTYSQRSWPGRSP